MLKIENNGNNGPNGSFVNMKKCWRRTKKTGKAKEERKRKKATVLNALSHQIPGTVLQNAMGIFVIIIRWMLL